MLIYQQSHTIVSLDEKIAVISLFSFVRLFDTKIHRYRSFGDSSTFSASQNIWHWLFEAWLYDPDTIGRKKGVFYDYY